MCSINVTAAVSAIGILFASQIAAAAAEAPTFRVARGERQLFLDDYDIAEIKNLNRTMHQPDKKGAVIRPSDPHVTALQTRSAPAWDPDRKVWKMWDCTTPGDLWAQKKSCNGYYESADGLHWTKPLVGLVERDGTKENNFVFVPVKAGRSGRLSPRRMRSEALCPETVGNDRVREPTCLSCIRTCPLHAGFRGTAGRIQ